MRNGACEVVKSPGLGQLTRIRLPGDQSRFWGSLHSLVIAANDVERRVELRLGCLSVLGRELRHRRQQLAVAELFERGFALLDIGVVHTIGGLGKQRERSDRPEGCNRSPACAYLFQALPRSRKIHVHHDRHPGLLVARQ